MRANTAPFDAAYAAFAMATIGFAYRRSNTGGPRSGHCSYIDTGGRTAAGGTSSVRTQASLRQSSAATGSCTATAKDSAVRPTRPAPPPAAKAGFVRADLTRTATPHPASALTFTAIDLETTGLDPDTDRIVEIGLDQVHRGRHHHRRVRNIGEQPWIPPRCTRRSRHRGRRLIGAPTTKQILQEAHVVVQERDELGPGPGHPTPLSGDGIRTRPLGCEPTSRHLPQRNPSQTRTSRSIRPSQPMAPHLTPSRQSRRVSFTNPFTSSRPTSARPDLWSISDGSKYAASDRFYDGGRFGVSVNLNRVS